VAGLAVSIFQALTQINEITLTFIPKIAATAAALVLFGPWMIARMVSFTTTLFLSLPSYVR
jgi:flagellar biosynthetic protein FliQ